MEIPVPADAQRQHDRLRVRRALNASLASVLVLSACFAAQHAFADAPRQAVELFDVPVGRGERLERHARGRMLPIQREGDERGDQGVWLAKSSQ